MDLRIIIVNRRYALACIITTLCLAAFIGYKSVSGNREEPAVETSGVMSASADSDVKKVALTFDDGPHPHYTEQLLDGLKERGVHVTFFVTGEHAELHPAIIKRMSEEGHLVGNHTYSHIQLSKGNREAFREELIKTNEIITGITGEEVLYVRPPYGTWDKAFETELNMFPVLWTVEAIEMEILGKKSPYKQEKILIQTLQAAY